MNYEEILKNETIDDLWILYRRLDHFVRFEISKRADSTAVGWPYLEQATDEEVGNAVKNAKKEAEKWIGPVMKTGTRKLRGLTEFEQMINYTRVHVMREHDHS